MIRSWVELLIAAVILTIGAMFFAWGYYKGKEREVTYPSTYGMSYFLLWAAVSILILWLMKMARIFPYDQ